MKPIKQKYPKLYIKILNKDKNNYELEYYDNHCNSDGSRKRDSDLIETEIFLNSKSKKRKLYELNKIEFKLLNTLIKKQEKVIEIYLKKNKKDQYQTINSSLELLLEYKSKFLEWFSNNKIL